MLPRLGINIDYNQVKTYIKIKGKVNHSEMKICDFPFYVVMKTEHFNKLPSLCLHEDLLCYNEISEDEMLLCFSMMKYATDYLKIIAGNYKSMSDGYKIRVFENSKIDNKNVYSIAFNPELHYETVAKHYGIEDEHILHGMDLIQPLDMNLETLTMELSKFSELQKKSKLA